MRNVKALLSFIGVLVTSNVINAYPSIAVQLDADSVPVAVKAPVANIAVPEAAPRPDGAVPMMLQAQVMPTMYEPKIAVGAVAPEGAQQDSSVSNVAIQQISPAGVSLDAPMDQKMQLPVAMMAPEGAPVPMIADMKNMVAIGGPMAMPPMQVGDMKAIASGMVGSVPTGEVKNMAAIDPMPVRDMKAMVEPMDGPMLGGPMPMGDPMMGGPGPMLMDEAMVKGVPMSVDVSDNSMAKPDGEQVYVNTMARPMQTFGSTGDVAKVPVSGDNPEVVPMIMAMGSPDAAKPMHARAEVMRSSSAEGAKAAVMNTQDESVAVKPVKSANGLSDAKKSDGDSVQTEVASDAAKKQPGTKKTSMKQSGGQKTAGSQKKGGFKAHNGKKNGAAKKQAQNGGRKGQNGANKKGQNAAKKAQVAAKKASIHNKKNQGSANLRASN